MIWALSIYIGVGSLFGPTAPVDRFYTKKQCEGAGQEIVQEFVQNPDIVTSVKFKCVAKKLARST